MGFRISRGQLEGVREDPVLFLGLAVFATLALTFLLSLRPGGLNQTFWVASLFFVGEEVSFVDLFGRGACSFQIKYENQMPACSMEIHLNRWGKLRVLEEEPEMTSSMGSLPYLAMRPKWRWVHINGWIH